MPLSLSATTSCERLRPRPAAKPPQQTGKTPPGWEFDISFAERFLRYTFRLMESSDLGLLLALDALLQETSVTRAARRIGLSTPAMSHALGRLRQRLSDPLLVRAGRQMVLSPRAESLRPQVAALVSQARRVMEPEQPFLPQLLRRRFTVVLSDYVLAVLGPTWDRLLSAEAPHLELRSIPNSPDDATLLREGSADLAIGIYGVLPPELRTRPLLTDRFVCAVRKDHPQIGKRLQLDEFIAIPQVQIAPRGKPGGYVDDMLAERGLSRRVARAVPYFHSALFLVSQSNYLVTVSERIATMYADSLGLRILPPPLPLRPYALSLLWHPRFDADPAHLWLREKLLGAAKLVASDTHAHARTRLDPSDPNSGQTRKRPGRRPQKS